MQVSQIKALNKRYCKQQGLNKSSILW